MKEICRDEHGNIPAETLKNQQYLDACFYVLFKEWNVLQHIDYNGASNFRSTDLAKKYIAAGANPFFEVNKRSVVDLACLKSYELCGLLLESSHLSQEVKRYIADKAKYMVDSGYFGMLSATLPRFGLKFINNAVTQISYCFVNPAANLTHFDESIKLEGVIALKETDKSLISKGLKSWEKVANIRLTETVEGPNCQFPVLMLSKLSHHDFEGSFNGLTLHIPIQAQGVVTDHKYLLALHTNTTDLTKTSRHEMGHMLGLDHPHDFFGNIIKGNSDLISIWDASWDKTVMAYYPSLRSELRGELSQQPETPMMLDIEIVQWLYGANWHYNRQNTTYSYNGEKSMLLTIWDGGGIDTINSTSATDVMINLQEASHQPSYIGHTRVWLAKNVKIENAITGPGNDLIIGNALPNMISSGAGDDCIITGPGESHLTVGSGTDVIVVHPKATFITITDCNPNVYLDLSEVLADRCSSYDIQSLIPNETASFILVSDHCNNNVPKIIIRCDAYDINAKNVSHNSLSTYTYEYLYPPYMLAINCIGGFLLGCFAEDIHYRFDSILLRINGCVLENHKKNKDDCRQEHNGIMVVRSLYNFFIRAPMPIPMSLSYSFGEQLMNNLSKKFDRQPRNTESFSISTVKAIGSSLILSALEMGSMNLVSPVIAVVSALALTCYHSFKDQKNTEVSQTKSTRWLRYAFFALDRTLETFARNIPGGKLIMDSLDAQEKAVKKHTCNC